MIPFLNTVKGESLKTSRVGSDCKIYQCLCIIFPACFVYCVVKMVDHFLFFLFLSNKLERGLFWICFTLLPLERKIFREVTTFLSKSSCLEHILFTLQIWFWQVWQDSTNQSTVCFYWSIAFVSRNKRPFFFFYKRVSWICVTTPLAPHCVWDPVWSSLVSWGSWVGKKSFNLILIKNLKRSTFTSKSFI